MTEPERERWPCGKPKPVGGPTPEIIARREAMLAQDGASGTGALDARAGTALGRMFAGRRIAAAQYRGGQRYVELYAANLRFVDAPRDGGSMLGRLAQSVASIGGAGSRPGSVAAADERGMERRIEYLRLRAALVRDVGVEGAQIVEALLIDDVTPLNAHMPLTLKGLWALANAAEGAGAFLIYRGA